MGEPEEYFDEYGLKTSGCDEVTPADRVFRGDVNCWGLGKLNGETLTQTKKLFLTYAVFQKDFV